MKREYCTQMEAARKGIITPELKKVASKENRRIEEVLPLVAEGKIVIPANINHKCLDANGVGSMLKTKINVITCGRCNFFFPFICHLPPNLF